VVSGGAYVTSEGALQLCCAIECSHDREVLKEAVELEPRSIVVHRGGVIVSCQATIVVSLLMSLMPLTMTELVTMSRTWSAET
jgi:hypothetical protein